MDLDAFEPFDNEWEKENAPLIAFEQWKINWWNITPHNFFPVVGNVIAWNAFKAMNILIWKK